MRIVIGILIVISLFFSLAGVVGMIRMPDPICRMQSSTNIATLGIIGVIAAAILYFGFVTKDGQMVIKSVLLGVFYLVTNPIASHALAKAAYKRGAYDAKGLKCDQLKEDLE